MNWAIDIKSFKSYLILERGLAENSIDAYQRDVEKFVEYLQLQTLALGPKDITLNHLEDFIRWLNSLGLAARSQARIISGMKAFYKFLMLEDIVNEDPTELLEGPRLSHKIPSVLTYEEINTLIAGLQSEKSENLKLRNIAMLETLYACGLRVSELVNLKLSNVYLDINFVKVIGKGDKERIIPIGEAAINAIQLYLTDFDAGRSTVPVKTGHEDFLFLNRRGRQLTRVMVFTILKKLAALVDLQKPVSPHIFRHSFATHLIEGGANLKAVQDMLGHESITTTEIYTHLDTEYLKDTILSFHPRSKQKKNS